MSRDHDNTTNNDDDNNNNNKKRTCPCKRLPLALSSFTGAEWGDLHSLRRHCATRMKRTTTTRRSTGNHNSTTPTSFPPLPHDAAGNTPLHLAAQHGHVQATALLLQAGYDVTANYQNCGVTPLHRASFSGAVATMRLLLESSRLQQHPYYPNLQQQQQQQQQQQAQDNVDSEKNQNNNHNDDNDDDKKNVNHFLFLPDTSFGDHRIALHKAAAGGRYLAVQLLLQVHAQCGSLSRALQTRDAYHQTPHQVACSKIVINSHRQQQPQIEERQSVARWDAVAGGHADWSLCARLLLWAAQDQNTVYTPTASPMPLTIQFRQSDNITKRIGQSNDDDACDDCQGRCITTQPWELAFQQGLRQAVEQRQSKEIWVVDVDHPPNSFPPVVVPLANIQQGGHSEDKDGVPKTSPHPPPREHQRHHDHDHDPDLGKPCDVCATHSLALYPLPGGSLVCRNCKRNQSK